MFSNTKQGGFSIRVNAIRCIDKLCLNSSGLAASSIDKSIVNYTYAMSMAQMYGAAAVVLPGALALWSLVRFDYTAEIPHPEDIRSRAYTADIVRAGP